MRMCFPNLSPVSILPNVFPNHQKFLGELKKVDHEALLVLNPDHGKISIHWMFPDETKKMGIVPILTLGEGEKFPLSKFDDNLHSPLHSLIKEINKEISDVSWGIDPTLERMEIGEAIKYARDLRKQIYDIRCLHETIRILNF